MSEIAITFGDSMAILTTRGAALISLVLAGVEITPRPSPASNPFHGVTLAPWPNRVFEGRYSVGTSQFELTKNDPLGHALHGLVFDQTFQITGQSKSSATFEFELSPQQGYPWNLLVKTQYSLDEQGLSVQIEAKNLSDSLAPVGLGIHPFFRIDEASRLTVHANNMAIHDSRMMPIENLGLGSLDGTSGAIFRTSGARLDTQFQGIGRVAATLRTSIGEFEILQTGADWLMVYTDDEFLWDDGTLGAVAIEPQTCPADAFNTGEGLKTLAPGETFGYSWGIRKSS